MQAQDHINNNLNQFFIQITIMITCKSKRNKELLSNHALKKRANHNPNKNQGNEV